MRADPLWLDNEKTRKTVTKMKFEKMKTAHEFREHLTDLVKAHDEMLKTLSQDKRS